MIAVLSSRHVRRLISKIETFTAQLLEFKQVLRRLHLQLCLSI